MLKNWLFTKTSGGVECAIYKIQNLTNSKIYIGQTRCIGLRRGVHRENLKKGSHHCKLMQVDFDNGDILKFSVVEMFPKSISDNYLSSKEYAYIEKYKALSKGYNKKLPNNLCNCKAKPDKYYISTDKVARVIKKFNAFGVTFLRIKLISDALHCKPEELIEQQKMPYTETDQSNVQSI